MLAPGAIECAHSTSIDSSSAQPLSVWLPAWFTTVSVGVGRSYFASNVARSDWMFGSWYISISAIVSPAAVSLDRGAGARREGDGIQAIGRRDLGRRVSAWLVRRKARQQTAIVEFIQMGPQVRAATAVSHE